MVKLPKTQVRPDFWDFEAKQQFLECNCFQGEAFQLLPEFLAILSHSLSMAYPELFYGFDWAESVLGKRLTFISFHFIFLSFFFCYWGSSGDISWNFMTKPGNKRPLYFFDYNWTCGKWGKKWNILSLMWTAIEVVAILPNTKYDWYQCLDHFSIIITKYHGQGNLSKKAFNGGLQLQRVSPRPPW